MQDTKVLKTLDDLLLYSVLLKNLQGESLFDKVTENYEKALRGSSKENDGIDYKDLITKLISESSFVIPENLQQDQVDICKKLKELWKFQAESNLVNLSLHSPSLEIYETFTPLIAEIFKQPEVSQLIKILHERVQAGECIDYPTELASLRSEIKSHIEKDQVLQLALAKLLPQDSNLQLQAGVLLISGKKASKQEWEKDFIELVNKNKDFLGKTPPAIPTELAESMKKLGDEITIDKEWKIEFLLLVRPIIEAFGFDIFSEDTQSKLDARSAKKWVEKLEQQKANNKGIGAA